MSKSALHHDRDGNATDALRKFFPKFWIYKNPADILSNKEYSEDLIIEIVNNDSRRTVTGVEFGVQNKTKISVYKNHVTVILSVEDIKRLMDLQRPVLIHGHHISTGDSYWIWLNEWYPHNFHKLKMSKKNIPLKIPKTNILDQNAVTEIERYARWEHEKNRLKQKVEMIARHHANDYAVRIEIQSNDIYTTIDPKHDGAVPIINALDHSGYEAMKKVIEYGEPIYLTSPIEITNIPELIMEEIHDLQSVRIFPYVPENSELKLKVELMDNSKNTILKIPFILMRITRPGTIVTGWSGEVRNQGITFDIVFNRSSNEGNYKFSFKPLTWTASNLKKHFSLLRNLQQVEIMSIINLETERQMEVISTGLFTGNITGLDEVSERMALALVVIEDALNISMSMPKKINLEDLNRAEWIAEALKDGLVKVNPSDFVPDNAVLICTDTISTVSKIISDFEEQGQIGFALLATKTEIKISLLGEVISLGPAQYECYNAKILKLDELKEKIEALDGTEDSTVNVVFDIDREEIYIAFEKWRSLN